LNLNGLCGSNSNKPLASDGSFAGHTAPFLILAMLGLGLSAFVMSEDQDDTDTPAPDEEPDVVEPAEEDPDAGASFVIDGDTITIDVGENETGTVVAIRTELMQNEAIAPDTAPELGNGYQQTTEFGVQFFLVPDGQDFPPSVEDVLAYIGGDTGDVADNRPVRMVYQDYLDNMGAERLGSVDLGTYVFFNPTTDADAPNVITDLRTDGFTIESNQEFEAFDLITGTVPSFLPDGEHNVSGIPLLGTSEGVVADQSIQPADAESTFQNGIMDITVDADVEGQLIAIEHNYLSGDDTTRVIEFYVLPENTEFTLTVAEVHEAVAGKGLDYLGYHTSDDAVAMNTMLLVTGAQEIGSVRVGSFGSFFGGSPDGGIVTYNTLSAYEIRDTVNYTGFRFNPDNVNDNFVYDTGPNAIIAVETLTRA